MNDHHRIETVVIGGGQVGLTVGHQLQKLGRPFVILDASQRVGDAWRKRWDSLRLFTPARYNGLPGMRFPAPGNSIVTKDQMADFLDEYATHFGLPVKSGRRVEKLTRSGDCYLVKTGDETYEADNVIVAMGNHQVPKIPAFASELDPTIVQIHSDAYKSPDQLQAGDTLVVGTANSGADIAFELSKDHRTFMAGKDVGEIPFRIEPAINRQIFVRIVRFVGHHVLSIRTPAGRKVRAKLKGRGMPRVRVKMRDLTKRGVERVPRVGGVKGSYIGLSMKLQGVNYD
jgi:putative flavoprotein involved in K+ transport